MRQPRSRELIRTGLQSPTTRQTSGNPGRFVWAELLTRDVGAAAEFYGKVFGWTFETYGPADDLKTYTVVLSGGTPIGGMVYASPKDDGKKNRGARWVGLMSVPDVQAAATQVEKDGGKVLMPPRTLGERGTVALFLDPEGGLFGAINSATGDPEDYLADDNQWLWIELMANDPAKMAEFYKGIGAYDVVDGAAKGETSGSGSSPEATRARGYRPSSTRSTPRHGSRTCA